MKNEGHANAQHLPTPCKRGGVLFCKSHNVKSIQIVAFHMAVAAAMFVPFAAATLSRLSCPLAAV